jgi:hypothetical protein
MRSFLPPPHPLRDAYGAHQPFESQRHLAFQSLMARYGDRRLVDLKMSVGAAVASGRGPTEVPLAADRFARATVRIVLRQLQAENCNSPALTSWLAVYDRLDLDTPSDARRSCVHGLTASGEPGSHVVALAHRAC